MPREQRRAWFIELGRNIRAARKALGLRQCDSGLGKERLCRIEHGQAEISVNEFCRLRTAMATGPAAAIDRARAELKRRRRAMLAVAVVIPPAPSAF